MLHYNHILNESRERGYREDFFYNPVPADSDPSALLHCFAYFDSVYYPNVRIDDLTRLPYTGYIRIVSGSMGDSSSPGTPGAGCFIIDRLHEDHRQWLSRLDSPLVRQGVLISNTPWHERLLDVLFPDNQTIIPAAAASGIDELFTAIRGMVTGDVPENGTLEGMLFALIQSLHRQNQSSRRPPELDRALRFITVHLSENIGRDDIAQAAAISTSSLTRLFRQYLRCAPAEYVARARIDYARSLLENPQIPVKTIARQCGFSRLAYFSRCFKCAFGKSPTLYRRSLGHGLLTCPEYGTQRSDDDAWAEGTPAP